MQSLLCNCKIAHDFNQYGQLKINCGGGHFTWRSYRYDKHCTITSVTRLAISIYDTGTIFILMALQVVYFRRITSHVVVSNNGVPALQLCVCLEIAVWLSCKALTSHCSFPYILAVISKGGTNATISILIISKHFD